MPVFDPTLPAANSLISSSELRDQLNALNDGINRINTLITQLQQINVNFTDPVSAADLNQLRDAINNIVQTFQQ